jgi:hypothetical protein
VADAWEQLSFLFFFTGCWGIAKENFALALGKAASYDRLAVKL